MYLDLHKLTTFFILRQGEDWSNLRNKVDDYLMGDGFRWYVPMLHNISRDFVDLLRMKIDSKKEVNDVTDYLYKWAVECEYIHFTSLLSINSLIYH